MRSQTSETIPEKKTAHSINRVEKDEWFPPTRTTTPKFLTGREPPETGATTIHQ